jgi:ankyrin repeat protein
MESANMSLRIATLSANVLGILAALHDGADVDHRVYNGSTTSLHKAIECGFVECARVLLANGAAVNAIDEYDQTPLHQSAMLSHADFTTMLLAHGADVHARSKSGCTPLHLASHAGSLPNIEVLLEGGGDATQADNKGELPIDHVCRPTWSFKKHRRAITWLLRFAAAWRRRFVAVTACALGLWEDD